MDIEYTDRHFHTRSRIGIGEISFGSFKQSTYLGSCLSLILLSRSTGQGGLSHIFGHERRQSKFNLATDVIEEYRRLINEHNLNDVEFYLVGGTNLGSHVLNRSIETLVHQGIDFVNVDTGGDDYRKILLCPLEPRLKIYKYR